MRGAGLAVAGLAGQIFSAFKGAQANRANQRLLNTSRQNNEAFYNNNVNQDFLQTNAGKGVFERLRQQIKEANQQASNNAAVTGGTAEAEIAAKSRNQQNYNNAVNDVSQQATRYQQGQEAMYRGENARLDNMQMGINDQKAQNAANLAGNAANLVSSSSALTGFEGLGQQPILSRTAEQTQSLNNIAQQGIVQTNNAPILQGIFNRSTLS